MQPTSADLQYPLAADRLNHHLLDCPFSGPPLRFHPIWARPGTAPRPPVGAWLVRLHAGHHAISGEPSASADGSSAASRPL